MSDPLETSAAAATADDAAAIEQSAVKVQSLYRGFQARGKAKQKLLFETWAKLDLKEESELKSDVDSINALREGYRLQRQLSTGQELPPLPSSAERSNAAEDGNSYAAIILNKLTALEEQTALEKAARVKKANPTGHSIAEEKDIALLPETDEGGGNHGITLQWVTSMVDAFCAGLLLQRENLVKVIKQVIPILHRDPNLQRIPLDQEHGRITMVGDIHGQLEDLYTIFHKNGLPTERNRYLFNGDWVDRGTHSCEVVLTLFCFKILYPNAVFLNRGNHEARDINTRDGFEHECVNKYDEKVFDAFEESFSCLPLCAIIAEQVFVCHAGLFYDDVLLEHIEQFNRFHQIPPAETLMEDMLWSDPCPQEGRYDNSRGCALEFGPDVVNKFLKDNKLKKIMRSHECVNEGYEEWFGGKLVTVFSASNYTGTVGNQGAYAIFSRDDVCNPTFVQYRAQSATKMKRISMTHGLLAEDIVCKLLMRISANRLALIDHFSRLSATNIVARDVWSHGLQIILDLKIPFTHFQSYLGLPELGVDGKRNGPVDYMAFLDRFAPVHVSLAHGGSASSEKATAAFNALASILFSRRVALASMFRYFDIDGDGNISHEEFADGIDLDDDGFIQYSEFFHAFETKDPNLLNAERIKNQEPKSVTPTQNPNKLT
jgi:protein phosphatase